MSNILQQLQTSQEPPIHERHHDLAAHNPCMVTHLIVLFHIWCYISIYIKLLETATVIFILQVPELKPKIWDWSKLIFIHKGRAEYRLLCRDDGNFPMDERDLFINIGPFCREDPIEELFTNLHMLGLELPLPLLKTIFDLELLDFPNWASIFPWCLTCTTPSVTAL